MIGFLANIFIKDREKTSSPKVRQSYGILCGLVGIALNVLLFAGKFAAGRLTSSIAITADAFNNLSDAGSSFVSLIGFKLAGQKPDPDHPFGHGRIEYLSGLIIAGAILIMAVELIKSSFDKIIHPSPTEFSMLSTAILLLSIGIKLYMAYYNSSIGKRLGSAAMRATATDSLSDCLATSAVFLSTLISKGTGTNIDGYCGVVVGLFIFYAGISAAKETLDPLLGQSPDPEFVKEIQDIVLSHENILGIHDLIVHDYGPGRLMISLHAEVPANGNIIELHDLVDNIEHDLARELNCHAVIHMDPISIDDEETMALKDLSLSILKSIDPAFSLHDFRIVKGPTHTNIIFDILIPFGHPLNDEEIREIIFSRLQEVNAAYYSIIEIDKDYTKG